MKVVNFQMDDEIHRDMRMETVRQDKTIKQYLTDLVKKDLESKKEQTQ